VLLLLIFASEKISADEESQGCFLKRLRPEHHNVLISCCTVDETLQQVAYGHNWDSFPLETG
jgi:hypothetical protein